MTGPNFKKRLTKPRILEEFEELKGIMERDGLPVERALTLLRKRKDNLAIDELSPEALEALLALAEDI